MPQPENIRPRYDNDDEKIAHNTLNLDIYESEEATRVISCRNNEWVPDSDDIHSYQNHDGDWENDYDHNFGLSEDSRELLEEI
ncbi:MAG: hypothetical protein R6V35_02220 [Candidatus Nanohaloarchaea archaeon]